MCRMLGLKARLHKGRHNSAGGYFVCLLLSGVFVFVFVCLFSLVLFFVCLFFASDIH